MPKFRRTSRTISDCPPTFRHSAAVLDPPFNNVSPNTATLSRRRHDQLDQSPLGTPLARPADELLWVVVSTGWIGSLITKRLP